MKSIYPVIVLYKTTLEATATYQTLLKPNHIVDFMIYDNSPESYEQDMTQIPPQAIYLRDISNSGLPKAYNAAARKARELGYERVLLLDQDTRFSSDAWQEYLDHLHYKGITSPMIKTIQGDCFSPVDIRGWAPKLLNEIVPKEYSLYEYAIVNSGSCVPLDLYEKSGGYSERVKLDFSDFQFQLFVRRHESHCLVLNTLALQDFSNDSKDVKQLMTRFHFYLDGAKNYKPDDTRQLLKLHYVVLRHTISLFMRTHRVEFLIKYLKSFILNKRK